MAKSAQAKLSQELLLFLAEVVGAQPQVASHGPARRRIQIATCPDYPGPGLTTFVTVGASQEPVFLYRGLDVGFELTLTLVSADRSITATLAQAVLENLRLQTSGERRPFIEYNGIYAPGYPPHLLFTDQVTCTPQIAGRRKFGDRYVEFLTAVPLDDAELRAYDRNVPKLIQRFQSARRIARYPRR